MSILEAAKKVLAMRPALEYQAYLDFSPFDDLAKAVKAEEAVIEDQKGRCPYCGSKSIRCGCDD